MHLNLKVIGYQGSPVANDITVDFENEGGTIGRAPENDLVLPDPQKFLSRRHAEIHFDGNRFRLTDTSLSGTYIDNSEAPLIRSSVELRNGMLLTVGEFEIQVNLTGMRGEEIPQRIDPALRVPEAESHIKSQSNWDLSLAPTPMDSVSNSHQKPIVTDPFSESRDSSQRHDPLAGLERISPMQEPFIPQTAKKTSGSGTEMPDDFSVEDFFDDVQDSNQSVAPRVVSPFGKSKSPSVIDESAASVLNPSKTSSSETDKPRVRPVDNRSQTRDESLGRPKHASNGESQLQPFFEGAGIPDMDLPKNRSSEQMLYLLGEIFREMVKGMIGELRGRAETKNQFRLSVTTINKSENNPLKFSASVEDALHNLLNPKHQGFLEPKFAVQNGFDDMMNHQLAMAAAIQLALNELIQRFDPQKFERRFEDGVVFKKKAKCWEAFQAEYPEIASQAIEEFFEGEFVRAYESQMKLFRSMYEEEK